MHVQLYIYTKLYSYHFHLIHQLNLYLLLLLATKWSMRQVRKIDKEYIIDALPLLQAISYI